MYLDQSALPYPYNTFPVAQEAPNHKETCSMKRPLGEDTGVMQSQFWRGCTVQPDYYDATR